MDPGGPLDTICYGNMRGPGQAARDGRPLQTGLGGECFRVILLKVAVTTVLPVATNGPARLPARPTLHPCAFG